MKVEGWNWPNQNKLPSKSPALVPQSWNEIIKIQFIPEEPTIVHMHNFFIIL